MTSPQDLIHHPAHSPWLLNGTTIPFDVPNAKLTIFIAYNVLFLRKYDCKINNHFSLKENEGPCPCRCVVLTVHGSLHIAISNEPRKG